MVLKTNIAYENYLKLIASEMTLNEKKGPSAIINPIIMLTIFSLLFLITNRMTAHNANMVMHTGKTSE